MNSWKDYSLTQIASQAVKYNLTEEDKREILFIAGDLISAKSCNQIRDILENNDLIRFFEKELYLESGFLFDVFRDYNYEEALLQLERSPAETVAFSIVSVWKTEFTLEEIDYLLNKINKCYPHDYVEFYTIRISPFQLFYRSRWSFPVLYGFPLLRERQRDRETQTGSVYAKLCIISDFSNRSGITVTDCYISLFF